MGDKPSRDAMPTPITGAVAAFPEEMQPLFVELIGARDPGLRTILLQKDQPGKVEQLAVEAILGDEPDTQLVSPDWEPTGRGIAIEKLIRQFFVWS